MKKLPENSYLNVQAFMVNDLDLKGNELLVYALIYGFSQDQESRFKGSLAYIQTWINAGSKHTVISAINALEEKNLIVKHQEKINGVTFNNYIVNFEKIAELKTKSLGSAKCALHVQNNGNIKNAPVVQNVHHRCKISNNSAEVAPGVVQNFPHGSAEIAPNNINNNINNNSSSVSNTLHEDKEEEKFIKEESNNPLENENQKQQEEKIPSLTAVKEYAETFGEDLYQDPIAFFNWMSSCQWKDKEGKSIENWKRLFVVCNNREKLKQAVGQEEDKTQEDSEKKELIKMLNFWERVVCPVCGEIFRIDNENTDITNKLVICPHCGKTHQSNQIKKCCDDRIEKELAANPIYSDDLNMQCPKCGKIYPDLAIKYDFVSGNCRCVECGEKWNSLGKDTDDDACRKGEGDTGALAPAPEEDKEEDIVESNVEGGRDVA